VNTRKSTKLVVALAVAAAAAVASQARASRELVKFPARYADDVHYATVTRGGIREEIFATSAAIETAKKGQALPSGTVITMEDYRDGKLFRYIVMEKRAGWGAEYPPEQRNGEWEFQAFNADKTVNEAENVARCFSCHKSQSAQDFVFTAGRMKDAR
jgi:Cytochrome P460